MAYDLSQFFLQLSEALNNEDGTLLEYLLKPQSPHAKDLLKAHKNPTVEKLSYYKGSMESPWDDIAIEYVMVCHHISKRRAAEAFNHQGSLVQHFYKYFTTQNGWTLPCLFGILRDLRDMAHDADLETTNNHVQSSSCMEEAATKISRALNNCLSDRISAPELSRKWGVYYVVGLIFKCYFRVKTIGLSKNIFRALDAQRDLPPLTHYPRPHQVTYRYYVGMIRFLGEDWDKAETELTLAFYNCHDSYLKNQERILAYLIPLRILRGHLPSSELMERYPGIGKMLTPFVDAVRKGDLAAYDKALDKWERRLVETNLWIVLERGREVCMRGLFRRVWIASDKSTRIPLAMFHSATRISGIEASVEEVECFVANMIFKGFMRGYISHEKQMVVLAVANAFPHLAERPEPYKQL